MKIAKDYSYLDFAFQQFLDLPNRHSYGKYAAQIRI